MFKLSNSQIEEALYKNAFEYASNGKAIVTLDGSLYMVNNTLSNILGYSKTELQNLCLLELTHCEDIIKIKSLFNGTLPNIEGKLIIDQRFIHKNGNELWVALHFSLLNMTQENKSTSYYLVDIYDISRQIEKEKEIKKLHQIHQLILDSISDGIFGIDLSTKVIFSNKAAEEMVGYSQEDLMKNDLHGLIHHTTREGESFSISNCPIYKALISGEMIHVSDDIFWRKDGSSFDVEYQTSPIIENDQYIGSVVTFRDITEIKRTKEFLQKSEKLSLVGQMAAGIAHEIRNPLTALKGFLQLIKSGESEKQLYYKIMNEEFNRIELILNELLLLAKPKATSLCKNDIISILDQVVAILQPQCNIQNVQVKCDYKSENIFVNCDENQLKQVFINLIKNAIDAMPNGGGIILAVRRDGDQVFISVKDQGIGIPEDKLDAIGQPFFSLKENGTGLGLMTSFGIIENHNGKITVTSKENKGTTFTVTLPSI
ncbi:PAS domain S-box protein [Alkalihalobacterium alkalinitrilicum]|uniref:PAS domain S-box protein n=1 Tax=Alkalihalobacterium alkalinitrilicum TaxID=427920 RepID=UPI000994F28D|nr:PAS domain S-box protein [Alkalihalobacterium alkalinitrilicum]